MQVDIDMDALIDALEGIGGCSDGHCIVTGPALGMHTNGGCRCGGNVTRPDYVKLMQIIYAYQRALGPTIKAERKRRHNL